MRRESVKIKHWNEYNDKERERERGREIERVRKEKEIESESREREERNFVAERRRILWKYEEC